MCKNEIALAALRRGHVTWEKLHPRVRLRLELAGYTASYPRRAAPAEDDYDHVFDD